MTKSLAQISYSCHSYGLFGFLSASLHTSEPYLMSTILLCLQFIHILLYYIFINKEHIHWTRRAECAQLLHNSMQCLLRTKKKFVCYHLISPKNYLSYKSSPLLTIYIYIYTTFNAQYCQCYQCQHCSMRYRTHHNSGNLFIYSVERVLVHTVVY